MRDNKKILISSPEKDYELLDSGEGEKLERFGDIVLSRPDPQALWRKGLDNVEWKKADASFSRDEKGGDWIMGKNSKIGEQGRWSIEYGDLKFWIKPTPFKHVGIFPEQAVNWDWLRECISVADTLDSLKNLPEGSDTVPSTSPNRSTPLRLVPGSVEPLRADVITRGTVSDPSRDNLNKNVPEVLNLFAYTGGATLACVQAGAKVVHVDSSKSAMAWARENAELSGLKDKPIRWILDDAQTFVRREIKRGRKYDGIIMDPPAFGHGPDNEVWKIEENFLSFIESCFELLSEKPLFFLVNGYSSGYSAIAYENILTKLVEKYGGKIESGELAIKESKSDRLLPCGIFSRWH